ncbi:hypothetical protein [Muricoccus aerilatus]|uniref:hypothetical protein n=1 Tax=Muricoccus aerilatus TaxID=452982 RepID=UPI000AFBF1A6|nr:hypothetical protein [Roseomonas aerilata]
MMPFSTKDTELLGHLTRRLGSDHQAEADTARERISQLLARHGLNFNDYAEWVEAGVLADGHAEPQRENVELRNEIARLREEALGLEAELVSLRSAARLQLVPAAVPWPGTRTNRPRKRHTSALVRTAVFSLIAALPLGWFLSGPHRPLPARPAASIPARDILPAPSGTDSADRLASNLPVRTGAEIDPAVGSAWRPPVGSRLASVLEDSVILSTPFPSRATEQPIGRGNRVAVLRQLVANGRQWAEVTSPTVSGYIPLDLLDLQE